jgi:uncharacterized protein (DUF1330 family)
MSAYVIAQFDVQDVDMYYEYASKIFETTKGYGGRILAANDAEVREGSIPHLRTIVGEFPSLEKARVVRVGGGIRRSSTCGRTRQRGTCS